MNWEPGSNWRTWFFYVERPLAAEDRTILVKMNFQVLEKQFGLTDLNTRKYHEYAAKLDDRILAAMNRRLSAMEKSEYPEYLVVTPEDIAA
ncbi:MAG: hypothetical protein AB7O39_02135 [Flavobacteriaceae bacterium]